MNRQKSHFFNYFLWKNKRIYKAKNHTQNLMGGGWFNRELKIFVLFLSLISFSNLFFSNNTFALFTPTLSASIDNTAASVNGNQVINSTNKTTEIPLNLTVNTNNKTGYTVTLSSETENTALTNTTSTSGAKINSISTNLLLNNLPNNTWGYKFGTSTSYAPIPALSTPAQILQTAGKTNGDETNSIKIGMKLADNLESGNYTNKLILSFVSNPYTPKAIMTYGLDVNEKLKALETATNKIEHFKKSTVAPAASMNAKNIDDEKSDYEIKLWLDPADKTAYYYAEPEKVYLNNHSGSMFSGMSNITSLDLSNFDTSMVTDMSYMFNDMSSLTSLDLSNFDTSKVVYMDGMFNDMSSLTSFSNFDTSDAAYMGNMFRGMSSLTSLKVSHSSRFFTKMDGIFAGMSSLTSLDLSDFDTSSATNMTFMFYGMSSLTSLDLSNFDTSRVEYMDGMFYGMSSLTSLDLSNFDTSRVEDMTGMFRDMSSLTSLNLSNFDTSRVKDMRMMFYEVHSLTSLNLSSFNTSNVEDMYAMFANMFSLTSLDLSNFNTSNVKTMEYMLYLEDINFSRDQLETIYVKNDFDTTKLQDYSNMFRNRKKLRGSNGSYLADPSAADKTWLRIDDPSHGRPGYFTRKP